MRRRAARGFWEEIWPWDKKKTPRDHSFWMFLVYLFLLLPIGFFGVSFFDPNPHVRYREGLR